MFRPPAAAALLLLQLESSASLKGQAPTLIMPISYELTVQYYTQVEGVFFTVFEHDTTLINFKPFASIFCLQQNPCDGFVAIRPGNQSMHLVIKPVDSKRF